MRSCLALSTASGVSAGLRGTFRLERGRQIIGSHRGINLSSSALGRSPFGNPSFWAWRREPPRARAVFRLLMQQEFRP
jgi:hypothetical protein